MARNRRTVLKSIGAVAGIGTAGITSAKSQNVKIVTVTRPMNEHLNKEQIVSKQRKELASFVQGRPISIGTVETSEEQNIVGLAAAVNEEGQTRRYIGSASDESKVSAVHSDVHKYAQKFQEEL